jgi:hypothetical protein
MAHKFEPADEKYWAEQKLKRQAAKERQQKEKAANTNFANLFILEKSSNNSNNQK